MPIGEAFSSSSIPRATTRPSGSPRASVPSASITRPTGGSGRRSSAPPYWRSRPAPRSTHRPPSCLAGLFLSGSTCASLTRPPRSKRWSGAGPRSPRAMLPTAMISTTRSIRSWRARSRSGVPSTGRASSARSGGRFALRLRPDAGPDWELLDRYTRERVDAVSDTLGGGLRLPRGEARAELEKAGDAAFMYLSGPSGCGKTALAKAWLAEASGSRIWLSARDLADGLFDLGRRMGLACRSSTCWRLAKPRCASRGRWVGPALRGRGLRRRGGPRARR